VSLVPTICLERPVDIPGLLGRTATEGTVFPTMTDIDGSAPDRATESDAELTTRFRCSTSSTVARCE